MKITLVQSAGALHDLKVNFFKARMRINNVDSDLFVFPEMFCSGYTTDKGHMYLSTIHDKVISQISQLSVNRGSAVICGSPTEADGKVYDSALVIDGAEIHRYDKMVLKDDESSVFAPGDRPMVVEHDGLLIGLMVGEDLLSYELYRFYAKNGIDLMICISAFTAPEMDRMEHIIACRASEFSLPLILCNMVGNDSGRMMIGRSKYIGADGNVIEALSDSSDLREIRIDAEAMKRNTASRIIVPIVTIGGCRKVESHSGEGADPVAKCPITGK